MKEIITISVMYGVIGILVWLCCCYNDNDN
nr:MAG TPA: protein of unknown function (DUF4972) [Bacteriophage sp.]